MWRRWLTGLGFCFINAAAVTSLGEDVTASFRSTMQKHVFHRSLELKMWLIRLGGGNPTGCLFWDLGNGKRESQQRL